MKVTKFLKIYFLFIIKNNPEKIQALVIAPMASPISNRYQKILEVRYTYSNIYPTICNVTHFILSGNCSTCFACYYHPSSGAQTTVSAASGI